MADPTSDQYCGRHGRRVVGAESQSGFLSARTSDLLVHAQMEPLRGNATLEKSNCVVN